MPLESVNMHKKDESFKPTTEEMRSIEEKMKDPEFMKLMVDYMEDLKNPEYRKEEDDYLKQIEQEAKEGGDYSFDFIFPKPCFCVELKETPGTKQRVFVNFCESDKVDEFREETTGDRWGSKWLVPVSVGKPRDEMHEDGRVKVYDAVFHPKTVGLANRSDKFLCFVIEIAVENINGGYKERFGFGFTRMATSLPAIGTPQNQTVKREKGKTPFNVEKAELHSQPLRPEPLPTSAASSKKTKPSAPAAASAPKKQIPAENVPKHTITHRGEIDLSDAWNWKVSDRRIGVPKELVLSMELPQVASAAQLDVDVQDTYVDISKSAAHPYHGHIPLPFSVDVTPRQARFDKTKKVLKLTLKVVPPQNTGPEAARKFREEQDDAVRELEEHSEGPKPLTADQLYAREEKAKQEKAELAQMEAMANAAAELVKKTQRMEQQQHQDDEEKEEEAKLADAAAKEFFAEQQREVEKQAQEAEAAAAELQRKADAAREAAARAKAELEASRETAIAEAEAKAADIVMRETQQKRKDNASNQSSPAKSASKNSSASASPATSPQKNPPAAKTSNTSHIGDQDRVSQMMAKLEEARKEREAAEAADAAAAEEEESKKKRNDVPSPSQAENKAEGGEEPIEVVDLRERQKQWLEGVKKDSHADPTATSPGSNKHVSFNEGDTNDAKADHPVDGEDDDEEEQAREARRKLREARKRQEAEREAERLEQLHRTRMAQLPLSSRHILEIE